MQHQTKEVVVFGGSFNPPTKAHEAIIAQCLDLPSYDEVWVMPSGDRQDKTMAATDDQRLNMLETVRQECFGADSRLCISDFELGLPRPTETIQTVGALAVAYPDTRFWFVYGADSYATMDSWRGGTALRAMLSVLLLPRPGSILPPPHDRIRYLPAVDTERGFVSSTDARIALQAGRGEDRYMSEPVLRHIMNAGLYGLAS